MSAWVEEVRDFTEGAEAKGLDPISWALHVSSIAYHHGKGVDLPSTHLAELLVNACCCCSGPNKNNRNSSNAWKYLEKAISTNLIHPVLVIALLSTRVIPKRHVKPAAFRLYMEILRRHSFTFLSQASVSSTRRVLLLVDGILGLSQIFGVQTCEQGVILLEFIFCIIWQLVDAALEDEGLMNLTLDKKPIWRKKFDDMETEWEVSYEDQRVGCSDKLKKSNTVMSIQLIAEFLHDKTVSRLLSLARQNMQSVWGSFSQRLHLLTAKSSDTSLQLSLANGSKTHKKYLPTRFREANAISSGSLSSTNGHVYGPNYSSLWIPLDLFLEDAINGSTAVTNYIEALYGLVKALQAVNKISWADTFLSLWLAALRFVQRGKDLTERPEPHVDLRMCMLLSIVTLTIGDFIEDEVLSNNSSISSTVVYRKENATSECSRALVSCLQMLGEHEVLLAPPASAIPLANQAAKKALMVVSGISVASGGLDSISMDDKNICCSGNLRHLIVESCIARNLLDTSAYYWPGYVNGQINQIPQFIPPHVSSWTSLMKGTPLTSLPLNDLVNTPAPSLAGVEKIFEIAVNGSADEKISAATILCGASLVRGWNFQEYTVCLVVKLLSPPLPVDHSGSESHLISHAPTLNVILTGISLMDCVQVFSLHGLVPELACSLMPICEAFGSCNPDISWTLPTGEVISVHTVFSNAFVLLLRLWKFNHSPLECCFLGESAPLVSKLNPDYLLFLRNIDVLSLSSTVPKKRNKGRLILTGASSVNPIFLPSFPKLKAWYQQHQACLASTLSGLISGTPVHQNVDCLLNMMFKRASNGAGHPAGSAGSAVSANSGISGSSGSPMEVNSFRPKLPAWDIMEAVPFVVDAALTACSCGRLSSRDLVTGLKDLADFLPASLGAIVSYFASEVTRGVWQPAFMNGTDWPSPAANLATVEEHIKKIVAATGVDVPSLVTGNSPATLPLPLAAFLSLTITYNLDKSSELNLVGPVLENLATSCPWPSMPIVSALWALKVKRWSYYLTFSASGTIFYHNNSAVVQLLRSCFSAILGLSNTSIFPSSGVGSLLGHGFGQNATSGLSPVAPGLLYLEIHQKVRDMALLSKEIFSTLMLSVRELASECHAKEMRGKIKNSKFEIRYGQESLFSVLTKVKSAASLGAILIWLSGGSGLIQNLFYEILPSWFLSVHELDHECRGGMGAALESYTLAYFVVLCGMFSWGIDSTRSSKKRPKILGAHLRFMADAMDGKIALGCRWVVWKAYVTEFLGLLVESAPIWLAEVEPDLLKRLSRGLKTLNEKELAVCLLERAGMSAMGAAAELIIDCR